MSNSGMSRKPATPPAHSATHVPSRQWIAMLLAGVLGVFIFAGTAGAILYRDLDSKLQASVVDTSHLNQAKPTGQSEDTQEEPEPVDGFAGRAVNILLMGTDGRIGQVGHVSEEELEWDDDSARSDTTLLVHIPADRQSVTIVSIPRDLWMLLPECERTDGSISYEQWGMFNAAFNYGANGKEDADGIAGGIACTEETVERLTGLPIDAYAVFGFSGFAAMIEALGGVEICLDKAITDSEYMQVSFEAGCQVMDPNRATDFARLRHADTLEMGDGSDMERIERQQKLLGAMVTQAMNSNIMTDLPSMYQFLTAALSASVLSPSLGDISTDVGLINSIKHVEPENIRFTTMPVLQADWDVNRLVPKEPLNHELWQALRDAAPLPEGLVYRDMLGDYFTVGPDDQSIPGGNPRTDDEVGSIDSWSYYDWYTNGSY